MDPVEEFRILVENNIKGIGEDKAFLDASNAWVRDCIPHKYALNFTWLGRPVIQTPMDLYAIQELIWTCRPDLIIETVNAWAPNFKASVLGRMILSPLDLERKLGLSGGDIMHGNMSLDQLWAARPVLGHASHRAPIKGLYMCGAGTHPGGGVSGNPGRNAAREVLRDHSLGRAIGLALQGR